MPSSSAGSASRMTEQANETGIAGKSQPPSASSVPAEPDAVRTEAQSRPSGQSVRGDEGALSERAGKFREVSTGVLDEATDDPGGRFVLIACALFALFIVILIFSFILK